MKKFIKFLGVILAFFIVAIVVMKLFFPIFAVKPTFSDQGKMIIDAKYVLTQKYFQEEKLTSEDFIVYSSLPGQYNGIIILPYWPDFYEKNKEFVLGKVILKIGKGNLDAK